jgi:hypothetical protein
LVSRICVGPKSSQEIIRRDADADAALLGLGERDRLRQFVSRLLDADAAISEVPRASIFNAVLIARLERTVRTQIQLIRLLILILPSPATTKIEKLC